MVPSCEKIEENRMEVDQRNKSHLHTVRFYTPQPRGISCMAYNAEKEKLALSRVDASVELWNVSGTPFMERVIFGAPNASVEALVWLGDNLFSAGLSGEIVHWNLRSLEPQQSLLVTGSSIWCMDVHGSTLAAGTEEGYLNICRMEDFLVYERAFDKQEGRILCCKFAPSGEFLATGSVDTVRVWNVQNGNAVHRMTLSRVEMRKEIIVWAIQYLPGNVVASADSAGRIIFWDGKLGSQTECYQAQKADALCLAINEDATKIFISGTEPVIRSYTLTSMKKDNHVVTKWVKSVEKHLHTHDVKALALNGNNLFSGGVDSHLVVSTFSPTSSKKFAPLLRQSCGEVTQNRLLLLKHRNHLEIWQLGSVREFQKLQKLLELQSRDSEAMTCSTLSPNGEILLYSTDTQIKAFHFDSKCQPALLSPIKIITSQFSPCLHAIFSQDSKMVFLVKNSGEVDIFVVTNQMDFDHIQTIDTHKRIKDLIHLVTLSNCGKYLALAGLCNSVVVWRFEEESQRWKRHISLPKYTNPATAMRIHSSSLRLVVAYLDGKLIEYDLEELKFTFSVQIQEEIPQRPINSVVLDSRNPDLFILQDEKMIFSIKKVVEAEDGEEGENTENAKKSKILNSAENKKFSKKIIREAKNLAFLSWLEDEEIVCVEIPEDSLIEQLPPPLKIKKYGTG
ncbi:U3 small nucleolar RNA-associated protein 4 homolog [Lutzomyia longipalpis]|uniref:U3 small nucleolar RNA-associated protein 4 homolog n=1 Tax=Lutzomyia longipalpis TaxID=7200 RepID=UPI002483EEE3|nr:U3 small nucleolar RNA-associated protein 4 homolog [Lutzomyia longipalpis]